MNRRPRLLVACEFSGIIREAFTKRGWDAWSCDLLPTEIPGQHIRGDVLKHLNDGWDMMIAHPPCTYLTWAGTRHWNNDGRWQLRLEAINFFMNFVRTKIEKVCIENPLGIMSQVYRPADQIIHPYYFGDGDMKRTCLWLKHLPQLTYWLSDNFFGVKTAAHKPEPISIDAKPSHHKRYYTDAKIRDGGLRAKTFQGIADAMADQW